MLTVVEKIHELTTSDTTKKKHAGQPSTYVRSSVYLTNSIHLYKILQPLYSLDPESA